MAEAISLTKEFNDMHALVVALTFGAVLGHFERNPTEVERLASELIELSTRQNFVRWLAGGEVLRGWARSFGDTAEGVSLLENGIADNRATGSILLVPRFLALKAEALNLADRTSEALETIGEAEALAENLKGAGGVPNCTGSAARFSRPWVPRRSELSFILRSHQNRTGTEVYFARETR